MCACPGVRSLRVVLRWRLRVDLESRKAAEGRLLTRLFKARKLEDEKAKEEHAKVIKAMRALFKKEMRQEALEAAL